MSNFVINVNQADFQNNVLLRSQQVPVIVDFWAPWCGPCRMLGPVLERLAAEYNGQFVLAKVNSDHNPNISIQYQVRGIPAVKAFVNGRVVDEFVGAQPEPMVRTFIQRVLAQKPSGTPNTTQSAPPPADPAARLQQARAALQKGDGCRAQKLLQGFPAGSGQQEATQLLPLATFLCEYAGGRLSGPSNWDQLYQQAAQAARRGEYSGALYSLLSIKNQNPSFRDGQPRQVMQGIFTLLGNNDPLVQAYQPQMA